MLVDKNLVKESQGAKIVEFENMPPAMVENLTVPLLISPGIWPRLNIELKPGIQI